MNTIIENAFNNYFEKLNQLYLNTLGTKPTVPFSDSLNKELLSGNTDDEGYIQWNPIKQDKIIKWKNIEEKIGFSICLELKDYYNTFFFLSLTGQYENCELHFYKIDGSESIESIVIRNHNDAKQYFPNDEMFLIGNAIVNDDDSFFIYYDNNSGRLFCYDADMKNELLLSYSIAKTIEKMEAIL